MKDWINTDIHPQAGAVKLDVTGRFPIFDNTIDRIYSSHLFEHLAIEDGMHMLKECFRVLVPGGRMRLVTIGLDVLFQLKYAPPLLYEKYCRWVHDSFCKEIPFGGMAVAINTLFYGHGHRFIYDEALMGVVLKEAGFSGIVWFSKHAESEDPHFKKIDNATRYPDPRMMDLESMFVECEKPC